MSNLVNIQVKGLSDLQGQLEALGVELGVKALAQAARKAFAPVLEAARAMVPKYSGALAASLKIAVKKPKGGGDLVVAVGIKISGGPKDSAGGALLGKEELPPVRRWHFIELGTAHMAAHPYLRPALHSNASAVIDQLKVEISKSIQKALKKKAKAASANSWNTLGSFLG